MSEEYSFTLESELTDTVPAGEPGGDAGEPEGHQGQARGAVLAGEGDRGGAEGIHGLHPAQPGRRHGARAALPAEH